jgi:hypothetical protein
VGAMGGSERIIDVLVSQVGEFRSVSGIVLLFRYVKSEVFEQKDFAGF